LPAVARIRSNPARQPHRLNAVRAKRRHRLHALAGYTRATRQCKRFV
jgi:hypothetical protein